MKNFMNALKELYDVADMPYLIYDKEMATDEIEAIRSYYPDFEIPDDITPEDFRDVWNRLVTAHCEVVELPNGREVPRWSVMSDREIATAISEASDWSQVNDLCTHLAETGVVDIPRNPDDSWADSWDDIITNWCDDILRD